MDENVDGYVLLRKNVLAEKLKMLKYSDKNCDWVCILCHRGFKERKFAKAHITSDSHGINVKDEELNQLLSGFPVPSDDFTSKLTESLEGVFSHQSAAWNNNISIRNDIASELENFLHKEFPDVTVGIHGSSVSGFALLGSNVNINLSIPESEGKKNRVPSVMKGVTRVLKKESQVYSEVVEDYYSFNRIPRILFEHRKSKLKGEIRVNVGSPLSLAFLLQLYQCMDTRVLKLGVLFRYWAKVCCVDCQEDGHYPAHMFIIMVIHFLQQRQPPVVPVLHEMFPQLQQKDQASNSSPGFITSEIIEQILTSELNAWKSSNSESLGQLWHSLLKYYAVDFQIEKYAVSILRSDPLSREENQWGSLRLAVEDPMIPRSNLARAGNSDKVFHYLWSSLKLSVVYFSELRQPGIGIKLEDPSVVCALNQLHVSSSDTEGNTVPGLCTSTVELCLSSDMQKSPASESKSVDGEDLAHDLDLSDDQKDSNVNVSIPRGHSDSSFNSDVGIQQTLEVKTTYMSSTAIDSNSDIQSSTKSSVHEQNPESIEKKNEFAWNKEDMVYHAYPLTCLNCKKLHHNVENCPMEKLPDWQSKFPKVQPSSSNMRMMKEIFKKYMRDTSPREEELQVREEICHMILHDIQQIYPSAQLDLFGSSANGFGSYKSDLDICLTLPELTLKMKNRTDQNEIIEKIARELKKCKDYQNIVTITTARVPIIKLSLPRFFSEQECDISLENRLALRNTKMIAAYAKLDERLKLLGYVVKHFAKVCDMGDASSGSLSSYAYILMMIHYLQRTDPPVVPCLQKLPTGHSKIGPLINSWDCYFYEKSSHSLAKVWPHYRRNQEPVSQLWLGFLRYYLDFDWCKQVVTIKQLEPLPTFEKWWLTKAMCIEDPFDLDHNLAASVTAKMRMYILERFFSALCHHSTGTPWRNIDHLMDPNTLVGEQRAPKFLNCYHCGMRGHKIGSCPNRRTQNTGGKGRKRAKESVHKKDSATLHSQQSKTPPIPRHDQGFPVSAIPMQAAGNYQPVVPPSPQRESPPHLPMMSNPQTVSPANASRQPLLPHPATTGPLLPPLHLPQTTVSGINSVTPSWPSPSPTSFGNISFPSHSPTFSVPIHHTQRPIPSHSPTFSVPIQTQRPSHSPTFSMPMHTQRPFSMPMHTQHPFPSHSPTFSMQMHTQRPLHPQTGIPAGYPTPNTMYSSYSQGAHQPSNFYSDSAGYTPTQQTIQRSRVEQINNRNW